MNDPAKPSDETTSFAAAAGPRPDATDAKPFSGSQEQLGTTIGRYKLLEKIGEGGFGVVYVAEQKEPVKRRIALKIIKLGMDTRQVVARFEAERQALALMDHPNIARVLDAGATDTGRPYFVMELVRGIRITDYCDQHRLPIQKRLELFIQVCHAIQHAHQKGIIHRDIKPSNILVTLHDGIPVPKVIDFGIAKATQQDLTDKTLYTQLQQFIGTPAYMSPEQAEMSGLDIDTRSDIYSLGVLLYELLTGRTPFDGKELMSQGIDAMRKAIREKEPPKPSSKVATLQREELSTTAARHAADPPRLIHLLRGDLDWIVMKCLDKDRTRRYETANGLAMDLQRHFQNEPITARPPSSAYRFQKMVRRNRFAVAAVAAVTCALFLGIIASTWQAVRATQAKRDAIAAQSQEAVQRQKAVEAQASETTLRQRAQDNELAARQLAYASDMNVAKEALDGNNLGRALDLLNRQRPRPGQTDLRGWEWRYLWQQTRSDDQFTLCRQKSEITSLAVSPDGRWLAIGMLHKEGLCVWDLQTRQQVAQLAQDETSVFAAFSPTQSLLAFTSVDARAPEGRQFNVHLWDASAQRMVGEFPLDRSGRGLAFAADGETLLTSTDSEGPESRITLWRMPSGSKVSSFPDRQFVQAGQFGSTNLAVTSDLTRAAYATPSGQIRAIDLRDGRPIWTVSPTQSIVTALAFSPDGKTLASAGRVGDSDIRLRDATTGNEIGRLTGHTDWVSSLVFWPDGKRLASSSADQTIRIWDVAGRKSVDVLRGHRDEVWRLALLPGEKTLVSASKDGIVSFWDTSITHPRQPHIAFPDKVDTWCFAPDSHSILTLDGLGHVTRWTGSGFQQRESVLEIGPQFTSKSWFNVFSNDGRFLATGSNDGTIQIWNVSRGVLSSHITCTKGPLAAQRFLDGASKLLVCSQSDNVLHEWDLVTGLEIQSWPAPALYDGEAGLSPDERLTVGTNSEGDLYVRNLPGRTTTKPPLEHLESRTPAFSPDGQRFAVASLLAYVRVWNTATWREEATLRGFRNAAGSVVFSPDGQRLVAGGTNPDEAVSLWDANSWQQVFTLTGAGFFFGFTAMSPDGNSIASLSNDHVLNLWSAPSWAEIEAIEKTKSGNETK